ncbi:MAG: hypothetical protein AAFQ94_09310 [Bacteroidota bacterium]
MRPLTIQSNGMGQQSIAMYLLSSLGHIPRFDHSIFVDPGSEKKETYQYLERLKEWEIKNNGVPLHIVYEKNLYDDLIAGTNSTGNRFASIPAFTLDQNGEKGILRRQCTAEYKLDSFYKYVRHEIFKLKPKQWVPKETKIAIGITMEEKSRIRMPDNNRLINLYPFLNLETRNFAKPNSVYLSNQEYDYCYGWYRSDCNKFIKSLGLPIPPKSSCTFCPYQRNSEWQDLKLNHPDEFEKVALLDEAIRDSSKKGVNNPIYLHSECKPLREVDFTKQQYELFTECEGVCNT